MPRGITRSSRKALGIGGLAWTQLAKVRSESATHGPEWFMLAILLTCQEGLGHGSGTQTPGSVHSALIHVNVSKKTWTATETWNLKSKNRILWGCLGMSSNLIQKTLARGEIRCVFGKGHPCQWRLIWLVLGEIYSVMHQVFPNIKNIIKKKRFPADIDCGHSHLLTPFRRIFDGPTMPQVSVQRSENTLQANPSLQIYLVVLMCLCWGWYTAEFIHASLLHLALWLVQIPSIVVLHPSFKLVAHFHGYCFFPARTIQHGTSEYEHWKTIEICCHAIPTWLKPAARTWAGKGVGTRRFTNSILCSIFINQYKQYKEYKHMF